MTDNRNILISGAGISGLTLAYWLREWGFSPTIVERRPDLSERGYMIDFHGPGYDLAERMQLAERLREVSSGYGIRQLVFVDGKGKRRAALDVSRFRDRLHPGYLPVMRGDLESTIYSVVKDGVPVLFGMSIAEMTSLPDRVDVRFSDGTRGSYDLVVGADGMHSHIRRLQWGDEGRFARFLGRYIACSVIDDSFNFGDAMVGHLAPGVQTIVHPFGDRKLAVTFAFTSPKLDVHGREQQLRALERTCGRLGWIVPRLVEASKHTQDLLFEAVAQVQVETWYKGRVALVGDACQCLTLLGGQGASVGMAGAYLLADELRKSGGDHRPAFPAYQYRFKPEIVKRQESARRLAGTFVPRNGIEIALTHFLLNAAFWPGFRTLLARQIGTTSLLS